MKHDVTLVIGVPGSGKSWVCEQLLDRYHYVANDMHKTNPAAAIIAAATEECYNPVLSDVPFGERKLKDKLEKRGLVVRCVFIREDAATIRERYEQRSGEAANSVILNRISGLSKRAVDWGCFQGTSKEVLEFLRGVD